MAGNPIEHAPTQLAVGADDTRDGHTRVTDTGADRLAAGAHAGEYVIDKLVGAGAMGEVYAGSHPVIGKRVAVKVLRRELASSPDAAERFIREARAVNQVDHPNVVDVFAFGRLDDGRLYLVMDLIAGRSLRAALADGPLAPAAAIEILDAIAGALDAAHARGVVHRDLKPDNIVIADVTGTVFVLDFGIAKLVSAAGGATDGGGPGTLTGQGTWLGTPGYMAPEQWSADGAGPASDRYALGVIAFELLTGAQPFSAASVPAMMEQHFRAEIPTLSTRGATVPAGYDAVIQRALAKDPAARFPTAAAMVAALRACASTGQGAQSAHPPVDAVATANAAAVRRTWLPAAAGVGVLGVMIGGWAVLRTSSADDATHGSHARADNGAAAGTVDVSVSSDPTNAQVFRDGKLVGTTPTTLPIAPGERANLELRKPGYLPRRRAISAVDVDLRVALQLVAGFDGVWQLPPDQLRAFQRHGDEIVAYKLDAIDGERHYYRKYEFEPVDDSTVRFASEEEQVDARAPDDPTCHLSLRVQYDYDPSADALELRREHAVVDFVGGHCTVRSKTMPEPIALRRVDHASDDTLSMDAPAGGRIAPPQVTVPIGKNVDDLAKATTAAQLAGLKSAPAPKPIAKRGTNAKKVAPNDDLGGVVGDDNGDIKGNTNAYSKTSGLNNQLDQANAPTQQIRSVPKAPPTKPDPEPAQQLEPPPQQQQAAPPPQAANAPANQSDRKSGN